MTFLFLFSKKKFFVWYKGLVPAQGKISPPSEKQRNFVFSRSKQQQQ